MKRFKGWVIPGPEPENQGVPEAGETLDALCGFYKLFQLKDGHRFSTDDLLVAGFAAAQSRRADSILDLGSGIGTVAHLMAWKFPGARLVSVEAQSESYRLALKSIALNGLEQRIDARLGDFRSPEAFPNPDEKFDLITGSPPYFPLTDGIPSEHPQKRACRFEERGGVEAYLETGARHLGPAGMLFIVFPTVQEKRCLDAARELGLLNLHTVRVFLKQGENSLLSLYQFQLRDHLPETFAEQISQQPVVSDLIIRDRAGKITREYSLFKLSIGFPP